MTTKNSFELCERPDMVNATQGELTTEELANVQGASFDIGNIVGSVVKAVLPAVID